MVSRCLLIILLTFSVALQSCSSSSDDNDGESENEFFLTVNIKGSGYTATDIGFQELPRPVYWLDCQTDDELIRDEGIGSIQTSENYISARFFHYYDSVNFSDDISQPTNVIGSRNITGDCWDNFDVMIRVGYHQKNCCFSLDTTTNYANQITKIERLSSDSEGTVYAISGNFNATFIDWEDLSIPINGNYRFRVYVLN